MTNRLASHLGAVGRECPFQPGPPDGAVVRPALEAGSEPALRLLEPPRPDRQVGLAKPNAVIVRRLRRGFVQGRLDRLGRIRVEAEGKPRSEEVDRQARVAVPHCEPPVGLDQALDVVEPAFPPVKGPQTLAEREALVLGPWEGPLDDPLSVGESTARDRQSAGLYRGRLGQRCMPRNPFPVRQRLLGSSHRLVANPEQVVRLAPRAPPPR